MKFFVLIFALLSCNPWTVGAEETSVTEARSEMSLSGIPFYKIYDEKEIEEASRGNFITTSPDGQLFFGNETGIHAFDGTSWRLILETVATRDKVRSIIWTEYGVFASGFGTIGRLEFSESEGAHYTPLNSAPLSKDSSEFYQTVHRDRNTLFFVGRRSVVHYDLKTTEIKVIELNAWTKGSIVSNGQLLIALPSDGLVTISGDGYQIMPEFSEFVESNVIKSFEKSKDGTVFFATMNNAIYLVPPDKDISEFRIISYQPEGLINDITSTDDSLLAISVSGQGICVIDGTGEVKLSLEKSIDYRWSAANMLHYDKHGSLWVMFNSTVGKVLLNNPVTQIDERLRPGLLWPVAEEHNEQVYLISENRLYKSASSNKGNNTIFVDVLPKVKMDLATAIPGEDGLYIQADSETLLLKDNNLISLGHTGRFDRFCSFRDDPTKLLAISPTEVHILKRVGQSMKTIASVPNTAGLINKVGNAGNDEFWLEIGLAKVGRILIENGSLLLEIFDRDDGLPSDWLAIWVHEGRVLFTEKTGVYEFDEGKRHFTRTDEFDAHFPPGEGSIHRIATDPEGNIWAAYNHANYILWKQKDGSYRKDSRSLALLGERYANQFKFLSNGDILYITATELFHIDGKKLRGSRDELRAIPRLLEVSKTDGATIHHLNNGYETVPNQLELTSEQRNIVFRFGNTFSATLKEPSYQYYLSGLSREWSKWSNSNEIPLTKLDHGSYKLRIRSKLGSELEAEEITIPFKIAPTLWETPLAYLSYLSIAIVMLYFGYSLLARNLKNTNEKLETMVAERTQEIENKNSELSQTLNELQSAQDKLIEASRKAGMAEVATNVLHNVGNVLNSINVGILSLSDRLELESVSKLTRISNLINRHSDDLGIFFSEDPKGKAVPDYLTQLSRVLEEDFSYYQIEVEQIQENIEHVKKVISAQQQHAKTMDMFTSVNLEHLIESAITIAMADSEQSHFEFDKDFELGLEIVSDKHRILQMLTNFIKNSKESINAQGKTIGLISISTRLIENSDFVRIQISDNGEGISEEHTLRIFNHGFTTKDDGHGFGMHCSANSAKALGGDLQIHSDGLGCGATVTLTLPVQMKPEKSDLKTALG